MISRQLSEAKKNTKPSEEIPSTLVRPSLILLRLFSQQQNSIFWYITTSSHLNTMRWSSVPEQISHKIMPFFIQQKMFIQEREGPSSPLKTFKSQHLSIIWRVIYQIWWVEVNRALFLRTKLIVLSFLTEFSLKLILSCISTTQKGFRRNRLWDIC